VAKENGIGQKQSARQVSDSVGRRRTQPTELWLHILHAHKKRLVRLAELPTIKTCSIHYESDYLPCCRQQRHIMCPESRRLRAELMTTRSQV